MRYLAAKFDMVGSRRVPQRGDVQKHFLDMAVEINGKFAQDLAAKFVVTHGDEAQALFKLGRGGGVFRVLEFLAVSLPEVDFRCGVGLGTLSTALQRTAIAMDGQAWQNAQKALENTKRQRKIIEFYGFQKELETQLNALGNLLGYLQSRWTKEQTEAIFLLSQTNSQKEIARRLNISEAAVSKRLKAAGWQHYYRGRRSLEMLLEKVKDP